MENEEEAEIKKESLEEEVQKGIIDEKSNNKVSKLASDSLRSKNKSRRVIPRECLDREDWINLLATPRRIRTPPCVKNEKKRVTLVRDKLSEPPRHRIISTLQDRGKILPAPLIDRLINILEFEDSLSPEQAEELFFDTTKKKKKNKLKTIVCRGKAIKAVADSSEDFDRDAVLCQYKLAEALVRSILQWECPLPREEFKDIADVMFQRLKGVITNGTHSALDEDEKVYQQMRIISEIVGCWVAGVLIEVAQNNEQLLKEECEERKKAAEEDSYDDDSDNVIDEYSTDSTLNSAHQ
ncbi:uncharacterized protein LOC130667564 [Microplitis mediator]|uniref:uncharacterized protein LOC130667564 n=1 Tax=Microplitis mediator TaxID=375433 RepID=UPI00255280CA|nr:uncharacterized protein LOC130667564 [Microplitis mediator]